MARSCLSQKLDWSTLTAVEAERLRRLLAAKTVATEAGCLEWQGGVKSKHEGYGVLWFRGRAERAHRVFVMLNGSEFPPAKTVVRHLCGNWQCVNPGHLQIGTSSENEHDKTAHDNRPEAVRLDVADCQRIRELAATGANSWQIASECFLPRSTVYDFLKRESLIGKDEACHS